MICPICGYESSGNFCSNCGAPLGNDKDGYLPEEDYTFDETGKDWPEYGDQEFQAEENADASGWGRLENIRQEKREPGAGTPKPGRDKDGGSQKNSRGEKNSGGQKNSSRKNGGGSGTGAKDVRRDKKERIKQQKMQQKEQRKRDDRMKSLENEVEQLRSRRDTEAAVEETEKSRVAGQRSDRTDSEGSEFGEAIAKGAVGIVVLLSRLMQLASTVLMACMVAAMAQSFWRHGQELGDIRLAVEERNYGLAFYVGFAGFTLFMGLVWCLWILSRKGAGGGVRMKKYDTGRGFLPFLICLAAILTTGIAAKQIPIEAEAFRGIGSGVIAALEAVNAQWEILFFSSTVGAVLSLVRKIMRV